MSARGNAAEVSHCIRHADVTIHAHTLDLAAPPVALVAHVAGITTCGRELAACFYAGLSGDVRCRASPSRPMTLRPLNLVHLSDLHFIVGDTGRAEREAHQRRRILEDLSQLAAGGLVVDAVLVTGDIAYSGQEEQYHLADEWLNQLANALKVKPSRVIVCPGNHDVDWSAIGDEHRKHRADLAVCAPNMLDAAVDGLLVGERPAVLDPLANYSRFAAGRQAGLDRSLGWKTSLNFGDGYRLQIRGVMSVLNSCDGDRAGTMVVHSNQIRVSREPGVANLLMIHHGTWFWRVPDPDPAECGQHIVLSGHTHLPKVRHVENCVEVTAGAVHPDQTIDRPDSTYNVLHLSISESEGSSVSVPLSVHVHQRSCTATSDHYASAGDRRIVVQILRAAAAMDGGTDADSPKEPDVDADPTTSVSAEPEERAPLDDDSGGSDVRRDVALEFEQLGTGDRLRVIADLQLGIAGAASMRPEHLIRAVSEAVADRGLAVQFFEAAARARR